MSFNLYLFAFKNNEIDFWSREETLLYIANNKNISTNHNGLFDYYHADSGRAELKISNDAMISTIDVTVRQLSPSLVKFLLSLMQRWKLFLYDVQGINDIEHPTLFALSADAFRHAPLDLIAPCVDENSDDKKQTTQQEKSQLHVEISHHIDASEKDADGSYDYYYEYDIFTFTQDEVSLQARSYIESPQNINFLNIKRPNIKEKLLNKDDLESPLFNSSVSYLRQHGKTNIGWLSGRGNAYESIPLELHSSCSVVESSTALFNYLTLSFTAWSNYRDHVIGKSPATKSITKKESTTMNNKVNVADIRAVFNLIAAPLDAELRNALWQQVSEKMKNHDVESAFHDVFSSLDRQNAWVWMQVDVRDTTEVQWQAEAIARTWSLPKAYSDDKDNNEAEEQEHADTLKKLQRFDAWLSQFEKSFIYIESGDTYFGFVVFDQDLDFAFEKLQSIGINEQDICPKADSDSSGGFLGGKHANLQGTYSVLDEASTNSEVMIFKISQSKLPIKTVIIEHVKIALAAGRLPLVCLSASWCEPCQEMLIALHHEDARSVMKQLAIIFIEIEECAEYLQSMDIEPKCVPLFFDVLENGHAGEMTADGGAWDDAVPSVIAGVLRNAFKLSNA